MSVNKRRQYVGLLLPAALLLLMLFSGERAKEACYNALILCGRMIIPALFPFLVLCSFMNSLGLPGLLGRVLGPVLCRIYNISPAGASALLMGLIGGYPAGAAYIADMEQGDAIAPEEGERLVAFCNNSGPAFILGVMGLGVFGSAETGLKLYGIHILSALTTGLFFRRGKRNELACPVRLDETDTAGALVKAVKQSVNSLIYICGFVISFSVLISLMDSGGFLSAVCGIISGKLKIDERLIKAAVTGVFELGNAAGQLSPLKPDPGRLALAAGLLSWGGLSVHFQTLAVLSRSKIKGTLHLTGRLICAVSAAIWALILS